MNKYKKITSTKIINQLIVGQKNIRKIPNLILKRIITNRIQSIILKLIENNIFLSSNSFKLIVLRIQHRNLII